MLAVFVEELIVLLFSQELEMRVLDADSPLVLPGE